jgi:ribosome-associated translation inhibitor RaiA
MTTRANPATVDDCLRVGGGFSQGDRNWIAEQLSTLDTGLAGYDADRVELEVSVKDRAARGQKVTMECWIAGRPKVVATSSEEDLGTALHQVRDELKRQLHEARSRKEPRHNRNLQDSPRTAPIDSLDPVES